MAWLVTVVGPWHSLLSLVVPLLHLSCGWHRLSRPGDTLSPAHGEQPDFGHLQLDGSCGGAESAASYCVHGDLQHKGLCLGNTLSLLLESVFSVPDRCWRGTWHCGDPPVVTPALQQPEPLSASGALSAEVQTHSGFCCPRGRRFTDAEYPSLQPEFCKA